MNSKLADSVPRLKRLLPRFRKIRIAVLGDLMLDRYLSGAANRLSPEAAVPIVDFVSQSECLGGAANVAANLAALGAQVELFGVIGSSPMPQKHSALKPRDDEPGGALRACLRQAKILDRGVLADSGRVTTVKTRVIARHQQIVRIDRELCDPLAPDAEEKLFRLLLDSFKRVHALVLSDYDKGLIHDAFADRVLHACGKCKVPVFVKPKKSLLRAYAGARAVVCNAKEAGFYTTRPVTDDKSVEDAIAALLQRFACSSVLITSGPDGMNLFEEGQRASLHIPATGVDVTYERLGKSGVERGASGRQVFDVTGAGDTVLSVLSLAVAAGASLPDAAFLANTAAGVVVGKLGTACVSPKELAAALDDSHT